MTISKRSTRGRRRGSALHIPRPIADWFAGTRSFTFYAYTHPYAPLLKDYWELYAAQNPGAKPPEGLQLLIKVNSLSRSAQSQD